MTYNVNDDFEEPLDPEASSTSLDDETTTNEEFENKKNRQAGKHVLEVRRAIEDHLEQARLRKELDYLSDNEQKNEE